MSRSVDTIVELAAFFLKFAETEEERRRILRNAIMVALDDASYRSSEVRKPLVDTDTMKRVG